MTRVLMFITVLCCATTTYAADCNLNVSYAEIAGRIIETVDDYAKMETDFRDVNGLHTARPMRMPPSINIPTTEANYAAKADALRNVAQTRIAQSGCGAQ